MIVGIKIGVNLNLPCYGEQVGVLRRMYDKYCLVENKDEMLNSILTAGKGVSIFFKRVLNERDLDTLRDLAASIGELIETKEGSFLVVSAVNFTIEIPYNEGTLRLRPTEYFYATSDEARQIVVPLRQGLLCTFPTVQEDVMEQWLLERGIWNDEGLWKDNKLWSDL